MSNETNPGTVENQIADIIAAKVSSPRLEDESLRVAHQLDQIEAARAIVDLLAAQSQPAATVQEVGREAELIALVKAIAVEAQKAGLDVMHMLHSSSCAALAALIAEPAAKAGDADENYKRGIYDAKCWLRDQQHKNPPDSLWHAAAILADRMDVALLGNSPSPQPDMGSAPVEPAAPPPVAKPNDTTMRQMADQFLRLMGLTDAYNDWLANGGGLPAKGASPADDDLARLIETRLLGVDPDSQDLVLDDHDWRRILAALSPPASQSVEKIAYAIIKGSAGERAADHAQEFLTANWEDAMRSARAVLALSTLPHKEKATPAPVEQGDNCERCQGNGEIVTDWDRYLHGHEGDKGDEAVAECPDCNGTGHVDLPPVGKQRAVGDAMRWKAALQDIAEAEAIPNDAVALAWCRNVAAAVLTATTTTERGRG